MARDVKISNPDKVFWPGTGFTKGNLIDYYRRVAPVMVPHLTGRPITLRRWPDGIEGQTFFQKNAPKHRPDWMDVVHLGEVDYLRIDDADGLVWAANSAAIEIHPGLGAAPDLERPTALVLDLDPGEGSDLVTCCQVAGLLRDYLDEGHLKAWPKTSGSKGLQLYVPLNNHTTFGDTRPFAENLAQRAETDHPDLIVSVIKKAHRKKKVLIDWAQNAPARTTVAVYSVRARDFPSVSMPVTWDEVEKAWQTGVADHLRFDTQGAIKRIDQVGDLMSPVLSTKQTLPS